VYSGAFEVGVFILIVANCVIMAMEVDVMLGEALKGKRVDVEWLRSHRDTHPDFMTQLERLLVVDAFILLLFVLECLLRLLAERQHFFMGPHKWWNILDAVVIIISVCVFLRNLLSTKIDAWDRLRFIRVLRVIRVLQVIRMLKPLRKLRVMLYSVLACLPSLAWATLGLYCCVAVMAIYLQDVALYHAQRHNQVVQRLTSSAPDGTVSAWAVEGWPEVRRQLEENWGTWFQAQFSLLKSVTGGEDWGSLAAPFCSINQAHCVAYSLWIILVIFGFINITVGIFARQAQEYHHLDRHLIVEGALADRNIMRETLMDLFDRMDVSMNGYLSRLEIERGLEDLHIRAYFAMLNIDIEMNPDEFFRLLDEDGNDRVDRDEFAKCCMRLQGGAKPLELARIIGSVEEMKGQLRELQLVVRKAIRHAT
jgi:Ca2+-binding EF-hand superfamily protein